MSSASDPAAADRPPGSDATAERPPAADAVPGPAAGMGEPCSGPRTSGGREWVSPPADASLDGSAIAGMGSGTRGILITFEGVDGSGKSTQLTLLAKALTEAGYDVLTTREPGGTMVGEAVRRVLLDVDHSAMTARTEALLYAAARAQLVEEVLRPALDSGFVVLCDRYLDSSLAYQGYGRGLVIEDVLTLNVWGTRCLFPDLTLVFDVDEATRAARMGEPASPASEGARVGQTADAGGGLDRLEGEGAAFFDRVAKGYRQLVADHRHRIVTIDGTGPAEEVAARVRAAVEEEFRLFGGA